MGRVFFWTPFTRPDLPLSVVIFIKNDGEADS